MDRVTVLALLAIAFAAAAGVVEGMRIVMPRLGIDLPLRAGDVARDVPAAGSAGMTPEGAAFHFPGSATPGERGNAYIYGHARVGMFLPLWWARVGDEVTVRSPRIEETPMLSLIEREDGNVDPAAICSLGNP